MFPPLLHLTSRVYLGRGLTKHYSLIFLGIFFTLSLFLNCNGTWYVSNGLKFWNTISEGNGWKRGSSISIVVNYGEKKTVFEENLINSVPCHYNCRQKQIINYFKSFPTSKNIYRRPQNFCKNAQELLTTFYLAGVKLLKRKIIQNHTWCFHLHFSNIWWIQSSYLNCGKWFDYRSDG